MDEVHDRRASRPGSPSSNTGPGIADLEQALRDGYTSGSGLGPRLWRRHGRLSEQFAIESAPGKGTRVTITRWR
jgi:serine/threonine-protein kinase RsbT